MDRRSDAFVGPAWRFGTMDEAVRNPHPQAAPLSYRPSSLPRRRRLFEPVARLLDRIVDDGVRAWSTTETSINSFTMCLSVFEYLESYEPPEVWGKWA